MVAVCGRFIHNKRVFVVSILKEIDKGFAFPKPIERTKMLIDFLEKEVDDEFHARFNVVKKEYIYKINIGEYNPIGTLCVYDSLHPKYIWDEKGLRKFTAKEYWRLQGYSDLDFNRAINTGIPYIELYKQAGNAITYNVIYEIFKSIINRYGEVFTDNFEYISLFSGIGTYEMALRDLLL